VKAERKPKPRYSVRKHQLSWEVVDHVLGNENRAALCEVRGYADVIAAALNAAEGK
jgi:hypothetical protein